MKKEETEKEVKVEELQEEIKFRLRTIVSDQDALFLREKSEPVTLTTIDSGAHVMDKETRELADAMKLRILDDDALGIAAIQLGEKKRMFAMRKPFNSEKILVVINPKIIRRGLKSSVRPENCLSIDYIPEHIAGALVKRASEIYVSFIDEHGIEYTEEMMIGMDARVFQHEFDHLNGTLIVDEPNFQRWRRAY